MNARRHIVTVLGAGRVGRAIATDLATGYDVTAVDAHEPSLAWLTTRGVKTTVQDLKDLKRLASVIEGADLVINALPGPMGFATLRQLIKAGKRIVDISFSEEDPLPLDSLAKEKGATAVIDCGVAPGLSNMVLGYHAARMTVDRFTCYVGGLPKTRTWPYEYKAPFSPIDVIAEYTRPARLVEHGAVVTRPALSEVESLEFPGIGTLEAFNSDGLRTLLHTVRVPHMKEKTLRYPGHSDRMRVLRDTGFFSTEPVQVRGVLVSPMDLTATLLFPHWQLAEHEREFTVMRIEVEGTEAGRPKRYSYSLYDEFDEKTGLSSMARTTGYTCTAVARLMLQGELKEAGVFAPEQVASDERWFKQVLRDLAERGISVAVTAEIGPVSS